MVTICITNLYDIPVTVVHRNGSLWRGMFVFGANFKGYIGEMLTKSFCYFTTAFDSVSLSRHIMWLHCIFSKNDMVREKIISCLVQLCWKRFHNAVLPQWHHTTLLTPISLPEFITKGSESVSSHISAVQSFVILRAWRMHLRTYKGWHDGMATNTWMPCELLGCTGVHGTCHATNKAHQNTFLPSVYEEFYANVYFNYDDSQNAREKVCSYSSGSIDVKEYVNDITFRFCLKYSRLWASYQIRKIAGCACAGNAGDVFPATTG